jgi:S-adenosylmethionine decarboxylase proenzyme
MIDAAVAAGATVLDVSFRKFAPQGVSGVVIISESHLTIHTWPEYGYAAIDLFTCGDRAEPWRAFKVLAGFLEADHVSTIELRRGNINNLGNSGIPKREAVFSHGYAAGSESGV